MELTALLLSRLQFAFTVSFHIIFPSFTIGLAAWLTVLEALHLATGRPAYRALFDFWLKIFGVAFGLGVVSGIVLAFEFGTNWSELSRMSGPIQGPLLSYESSGPWIGPDIRESSLQLVPNSNASTIPETTPSPKATPKIFSQKSKSARYAGRPVARCSASSTVSHAANPI